MTAWHRVGAQWQAVAEDAEQMRALGGALAAVLRAGDVVVLDGALGAGKTTFTQGIGEALRVRGSVTSPTFVIARHHPGPVAPLVHVDAYRLADAVEVEDLDLDTDLARSITVIEWGAGKVDGLSADRLEVHIDRTSAARVDPQDPSGGARSVRVQGVGPRWADLRLGSG